MYLLNSKSIIDCDENEEKLHNQEIESIINLLMAYPNYDCAIIIKYFDEGHKNLEPIIKSCKLHDCFEMIEYVDSKNGVDIAVVDGYITFITYGQIYHIDSKNYLITQGIQVRPYNKVREFVVLDFINN